MQQTTSLKFYYNGIKVNGGKLIKFYYRYGYGKNNTGIYLDCDFVYSYDYLPADIFDIRADYSLLKQAYLNVDHPLYKFAYYGYIQQQIHNIKKNIAFYEKRGYEAKYIQEEQKELSELLKVKSPGDPEEKDLDNARAYWEAKREEKRKLQEEEDRKREAEFMKQRAMDIATVNYAMGKYPLNEGAKNFVHVCWSENSGIDSFCQPGDKGFNCSIKAANLFMSIIDENFPAHSGYDKTKLVIHLGGDTYNMRYDLGDHDGGFYGHIKSLNDYYKNKEGITEETEGIDALLENLKKELEAA